MAKTPNDRSIPVFRSQSPREGVSFHSTSSHIVDLRSMIAQREIDERKKNPSTQQHTRRKKEKKQASTEPTYSPVPLLPVFARRKKEHRQLLRPRLLIFLLFAVLCIAPAGVIALARFSSEFQTDVLSLTHDGFAQIQTGVDATKQGRFDEARSAFQNAQTQLQQVHTQVRTAIPAPVLWIARAIPGKPQTAAAGMQLVSAGIDSAWIGEQVANALSSVDVEQLQSNGGVTDLLLTLQTTAQTIQPRVDSASASIARVPIDAIPKEYREQVQQAQALTPRAQSVLSEGEQLMDALLFLLGHEQERRYFVLFQNHHELRPTGGFIGSLALIDIENGVVTELDVPGGGVYDIAGQFTGKLIAPPPLQLVNPHWNIQDANWFPDFPTSAHKVEWFAERSGYPSVDGVIAFTPTMIEELLKITGPIDLTAEYGVEIRADNFYSEVQTRAEEKFDETRESKKIIGAMTPLLFQKLFEVAREPQEFVRVLTLMQEQLNEKQMLVSVNHADTQEYFSSKNWSGELRETDGDYLSVVHTNIGGGKTDGVLDNTIRHTAAIQADGSIIDTVSVTRVHKGDAANALQNVNHREYVRFYIPHGSELISASGFEAPDQKLFFTPDGDAEVDTDLLAVSGRVSEDPLTGIATNTEFGKTVFGGWVHTPVGRSSTVTISYRLPYRLRTSSLFKRDIDRYSVLFQKQPGTVNTLLVHQVDMPDRAHIVESQPSAYQGNLEQQFTTDVFAGLMLEFR